jgi:peptidoglycan pentaglycine glycine transferase (the first glycine)
VVDAQAKWVIDKMVSLIKDPIVWNDLVKSMPDPHILQSWEWGKVKNQFGWQPTHHAWQSPGQATALALERKVYLAGLSSPLRVLYVPKGPLLEWDNTAMRNQVLDDLQFLARDRRAIFIKIDPDVVVATGTHTTDDSQTNTLGKTIKADLLRRGWRYSQDQIQFQNTVLLDLSASEEELLGRMKPKTRYNIRLAERKGVRIRLGNAEDFPLLYRMYAETSIRDSFAIREESYYQAVWKTFSEQGMAEPLIAEVDNRPVAALILFYFSGKAWYLYGMSRTLHREKMPNHLLQWEAMCRAKEKGCLSYDLWGAPDQFVETDPMWGVYRFKAGLGGQVVQTIGAWDLPARPVLYQLYTQTLPRILNIMRRRGMERTRESVS